MPKKQPRGRRKLPEEAWKSKRRVPLAARFHRHAEVFPLKAINLLGLVVYKTAIVIIGFIAWVGFEMSKESYPRALGTVSQVFLFCFVGSLTWLLLAVLEALGERHFHKCKLDYLYVGTLAIVVVVGRFAYTEYPVHRH